MILITLYFYIIILYFLILFIIILFLGLQGCCLSLGFLIVSSLIISLITTSSLIFGSVLRYPWNTSSLIITCKPFFSAKCKNSLAKFSLPDTDDDASFIRIILDKSLLPQLFIKSRVV